jgi:VWFA-related protein
LESALRGLDDPYEIEGASSGTPGQRLAQFDGTALYDAIQVPVDAIMKKRQGRKALILLSDGVDTVSRTPLRGAIEGAQRADTLIYSLCYADRDSDRRDQARGARVLRALAEQTGGRYFKVSREQSLDEVYSLIQDELRTQYNLGYVPASDGPAYRKIRISVNRKGLTVQSRDGYYRGA